MAAMVENGVPQAVAQGVRPLIEIAPRQIVTLAHGITATRGGNVKSDDIITPVRTER